MSLILENVPYSPTLSAAKSAVIRTLLYFDIFQFPLRSEEIFHLSRQSGIQQAEIENAVDELVGQGIVERMDGFHFLHNNKHFVRRRMDGEAAAATALQTAKRYSRFISKFPFVRGIALSGSLSKNYMDSDSDIDYFIITAKGRMWVARTLLILYKKIFLLNSHKNFCMNYFLTEDALDVPDRNIFTATEVSFLIPTYNYDLYNRFRNANSWSAEFLPHFPNQQGQHVIAEKKNRLKKIIENTLSGMPGEKLDTWFFRLTVKFWKKKFQHFDDSTFDFRLRSKKNVSKHHPLGFQEKVLTAYARKISEFQHDQQIKLHAEDPVHA